MENEWFLRTLQQEKGAFEQLIKPYESLIYQIMSRYLDNYDDILDSSQEALLKIYRSLERFEGKSLFKTWLYQICKNQAIDDMKKTKRLVTLPLTDELAKEYLHFDELFFSQERLKELTWAYQRLTADEQYILALRVVKELSYDEIARRLQIQVGTVKSRLFRARRNLKNQMNASFNQNAM